MDLLEIKEGMTPIEKIERFGASMMITTATLDDMLSSLGNPMGNAFRNMFSQTMGLMCNLAGVEPSQALMDRVFARASKAKEEADLFAAAMEGLDTNPSRAH